MILSVVSQVLLHAAFQTAFPGAGLMAVLPATPAEPEIVVPFEQAAVEEPDPGWEWIVAPYLWAAGIDGELETGNASVEIEVDFDDIWDNLESAGLIWVEARKGQLSLAGDVVYLGLDLDGETPGGADADAEVDATILDLAGLYRLSPTSPLELGLGLRYLSMDTELDIGSISTDSDSDAFDGVVVGRATLPFAERWDLSVYGDVGAGDSDLTWQLMALLGVHWDGWGLAGGYRMLDYDFEDGSDELDFMFEGLLFGVEFRF